MRVLTTLVLSLGLAVAAWAQRADPGFDPVKDVTLRFEQGAVVLAVPEGAHLKASFMEVAKKAGPGTVKLGKLPPTRDKDELGDGIWHGQVRLPVSGTGLSGTVTLAVTYQPCTEGEGGVCYPPTTRALLVKAEAIPAERPAGSAPVFQIEKAGEGTKVESAPVVVAPPSPVPTPARSG